MSKTETTSLRMPLRYRAIIAICQEKQLKQFGADKTRSDIVKQAVDAFAEREGISLAEITKKESELSEGKENRNMRIQVPPQYAGVIFELTEIEEFQRSAQIGGYIWPQDNFTKGKIHPLPDTHYRSEHFRKKIVENERQNGQTFWSEDFEALKTWSGAEPCYRCPSNVVIP